MLAPLILIVVLATVWAEPTCPSVDPNGPKFVVFPDETDCSRYYRCFMGHLQRVTCPAPLLFNPARKICDWSENVACSVNVCPSVDGPNAVYFPDKTDCSRFYQCSNGSPKLFDCAPGLDFNPVKNICDWPEQAGCRSNSITGNSESSDSSDSSSSSDSSESSNSSDSSESSESSELPESF